MTQQKASINRKELFLRACRGEVLPRVPVWMMRQAGRYLPEYREIRAKHAFLEVCKTPQLAVEVSIQPFRRLGVDAVIVFSDILIPAEAMGLQLELGDAGPNLPNPIRSKSDVERLRVFDPEPETFRVLLHRIAQATIPYLKAQIAAGATAVQLFDTWGGELNLQDYEDFALPAVQEIISGLDGSAPVIYYTKASQHLLPAAARSGANALSVDWRVDLAETRKLLGPKIALQGNVDPAVLFAPPEKIRDATLGTISSLCGRGHILNLGHGLLQNTPVENAQLFVETAQRALIQHATTVAQVR